VIELPVAAARGASARVPEEEVLPPVSAKDVLLVDDEPDVAAVVAEAIANDGHRVDTAMNGAIALEMLRTRPYDLIVSDTRMPELDGEGFYAEIRDRFPALRERVIFLSGDMLSREKREFLEGTGRPFLAKPCDLGELRRLVHRVLVDLTRSARSTVPTPGIAEPTTKPSSTCRRSATGRPGHA
jgi:CheY-like chemotaxis protein